MSEMRYMSMFVIVVSNKIYGKDTTSKTYSQAFQARLYEVVGLVYEMVRGRSIQTNYRGYIVGKVYIVYCYCNNHSQARRMFMLS